MTITERPCSLCSESSGSLSQLSMLGTVPYDAKAAITIFLVLRCFVWIRYHTKKFVWESSQHRSLFLRTAGEEVFFKIFFNPSSAAKASHREPRRLSYFRTGEHQSPTLRRRSLSLPASDYPFDISFQMAKFKRVDYLFRSMERITAIAKGRVQGVGYRYFVTGCAHRTGVHGFVRNLPDGTVHIVAESSLASLDEFVRLIRADGGLRDSG